MKPTFHFWPSAAFVLTLCIAGAFSWPTAAGPNTKRTLRPHTGQTPVIVELFTSEGCSSCPPADFVLANLQKAQPVTGAEVIALGLHVDYWNHMGWRDPYSSRAYGTRQSDYARHFHLDSVYTPQLIVDGQAEFVGSDSARANALILAASRQPKANVAVSLAGAGDSNSVPLHVRIDNFPQGAMGTADILLAVTEDNLHSQVTRGENAGHLLRHAAVTRELRSLGQLTVSSGAAFEATPTIRLAAGWQRRALRAVVFVQERATRRILGAAELHLDGQG